MTDDYRLLGFEDVAAAVRACGRDADHLVLYERRLDDEENLGRFDLDDDEFEQVVGPDDDPPDSLPDRAAEWVRQRAVRVSLGEAHSKFRVRVYGPKGMKLTSVQFVVRREVQLPAVPTAAARARELPSLAELHQSPGEAYALGTHLEGFDLLSKKYAHLSDLTLRSLAHLSGNFDDRLDSLFAMLGDRDRQIERLVATIVEMRAAAVEEQAATLAGAHDAELKKELLRSTVDRIGEAAGALVAAKTLPPDLVEVAGLISRSEELRRSLAEPGVRALLQKPDHLRQLADFLKAAGAQHAASTPPADGADGPAAHPPAAESADHPRSDR